MLNDDDFGLLLHVIAGYKTLIESSRGISDRDTTAKINAMVPGLDDLRDKVAVERYLRKQEQ